ncbi:DUF4386 domain-containing protein [Flagellimonas nanhaiensis]|uniref:DUF4386 domain-containing protein n=1 Tax=Flagellimonas nanhaiensis TaxID=2292706 RepID=A0A371JTW0_9FLAO|nr:DUF4386 domain-containing protein [Allomuricauda nanhaiensis]RDY61238.1 DUF4386 domain-containing protein [Allomuricauda nanhaiensis]
MKTNLKAGRTIGLLLFLIIAAGIPSLNLRGLSTELTSNPEFLAIVFENTLQTKLAIVLDTLASTLWLVIAILMYQKMSEYRLGLALAFFGLWIINLGIIIYSNIANLSLLSLSEAFVSNIQMDSLTLHSLGYLKVEDYYWAHFMALITYASAAFVLFYFLFRTRLVPRLLSIWGMLAISLVFFATWANIFKINVSFHFYTQNGIHMIAFMGWLIAKGFSSKPDLNQSLQ